MTPRAIRAGLRVAMRLQRDAKPSDRTALQALISAGIIVLRAQEAAETPAPVRAPGLVRAWGRPCFAPTELATRIEPMQTVPGAMR